MKIAQFLAMVFTALALVPAGAHLFSLPNKLHLAQTNYFVVQNIYRGWALFGIVLFGGLMATLAIAIIVRAQTTPFLLAVTSLASQCVVLAIFFAFVYPTNVATNNWTVVPVNWEHLRWQWEIGHAVNAVIAFIAFCLLLLSVLTTRDRGYGIRKQ